MKKIILLIVLIGSLMRMSFTTSTKKFQIVETNNGAYLTNGYLLSLQGIESIEKVSIIGNKTKMFLNTNAPHQFSDKVIIATDIIKNNIQQRKLNKIFVKYY